MRYVLLLAEVDPSAWDRATEGGRQGVLAAHRAFDEAVAQRGKILGGEALDRTDTATTLRTVDGVTTVTDGPFAETAEQVGGFYVVDLPDLDAAIETARLLPPRYTVEIRPVVPVEPY
ncbi:MAG TPA: YciI family protein [Nocardioides sp.]|uniref:YciI family protein n=1 Tax=Nocardioides sp. TaxID=35761 RepID=UPI002D7ECBB1|nr:YciI family protein [Nocardioides sp.]HET6653989.1 YciI family protein [Nocardioides sp.]